MKQIIIGHKAMGSKAFIYELGLILFNLETEGKVEMLAMGSNVTTQSRIQNLLSRHLKNLLVETEIEKSKNVDLPIHKVKLAVNYG